jgi:hypothetical protein
VKVVFLEVINVTTVLRCFSESPILFGLPVVQVTYGFRWRDSSWFQYTVRRCRHQVAMLISNSVLHFGFNDASKAFVNKVRADCALNVKHFD